MKVEQLRPGLIQLQALGPFWAGSPEIQTRLVDLGRGYWSLSLWYGDSFVGPIYDFGFKADARHAFKVASRYTRFCRLSGEKRARLYYHGQPSTT